MRQPFTTQHAYQIGYTRNSLIWAVRQGLLQRLGRGVYVEGGEPPTVLERALAIVVVTGGVASGTLAGVLHGLDSVELEPPFATIPMSCESRLAVRRFDLPPESAALVDGYMCAGGLQTMIDLAVPLDDLRWEQALESGLRKRLFSVSDVEAVLQMRVSGVKRMRRVMKPRPVGAPPTESLLETYMVQLIRKAPTLPTPTRQVEVFNRYRRFVARVDLAWPELGVFIELDGQQHKDQPVYDASRETAVVATKGWLPARFTWREVVYTPKSTLRNLIELHQTARQLRSSTPNRTKYW